MLCYNKQFLLTLFLYFSQPSVLILQLHNPLEVVVSFVVINVAVLIILMPATVIGVVPR